MDFDVFTRRFGKWRFRSQHRHPDKTPDKAERPGKQGSAEAEMLAVKVKLGRVVLHTARQCALCGSTVQVDDGIFRIDQKSDALFAGPIGPVDILVIHEKVFVESSHPFPGFDRHKPCCRICPPRFPEWRVRDGDRFSVDVTLRRFLRAKGVQEKLRMGNFGKPVFLDAAVRVSKSRDDYIVRKTGQVALQGFEGSLGNARVVVQQKNRVETFSAFSGEFHAAVVGRSETEVRLRAKKPDFRKFPFDVLRGSIRAAVVDDENPEAIFGKRPKVFQAKFRFFPLAVSNEDDGGF